MRCRCSISTALPLLLAFVACAKTETEVGSVYVKQALVNAALGNRVIVTPAESVELAGGGVIIPAGALAQDTLIKIAIGPESIVKDNAKVFGPAIDLEPNGIQFMKPVEVVVPVKDGIDLDRLRIFVRQATGEESVILPKDVRYDAVAKTAHFYVEHFTTYQCGESENDCSNIACPTNDCTNGSCNTPCDATTDCGPAPGVPSWTCEDGTPGGSTGQCLRLADGTCGWEINWCTRGCTNEECGPAPGAPSQICPDGTVAGPVCRLDAGGTCGWDFVTCGGCGPNDCTPGNQCDPTTGNCVPVSTQCGNNTCGTGEYCCNESCGTCAPFGAACTTIACPSGCDPSTPNAGCPPGFVCAADGTCQGQTTTCGNNTCGAGESCCNASCGICAAPGTACTQQACNQCDGVTCPPGYECSNGFVPGTNPCVATACDPTTDCGPALGLPSWTCEDGTEGGNTGRCERSADGACGWVVIWCPRACDPTECGPPPGVPAILCNDGTVSAPECRRDANDGTCGWVITPCP